MTFQQEIASWKFPSQLPPSPIPSIAANAPSTSQIQLLNPDGKPTILTFLRHCGCPFAEETFLSFRATASAHPSIHFVAISHSNQSATDKWLKAIGGAEKVRIVVDGNKELFAQWGLGVCRFWHVLSPANFWNMYKLGREQGISVRPTESGSRWQMGGSFAVDRNGVVRWGRAAERADWKPNFEEAVKAAEE